MLAADVKPQCKRIDRRNCRAAKQFAGCQRTQSLSLMNLQASKTFRSNVSMKKPACRRRQPTCGPIECNRSKWRHGFEFQLQLFAQFTAQPILRLLVCFERTAKQREKARKENAGADVALLHQVLLLLDRQNGANRVADAKALRRRQQQLQRVHRPACARMAGADNPCAASTSSWLP